MTPSTVKSQKPTGAKTLRIAIIGAGAAGLTAAHTLLDKGFERITIYEREHRVGGKVYSAVEADGTFELGALWVGRSYATIESLAHEYGIDLVPDDMEIFIRHRAGEKVAMLAFITAGRSYWSLIRNFFAWQKVQKKFGHLKKPGSFFAPLHPDLTLPFSDFAQKYDIELLAKAFRPFWVGCGYLYFETVPAIYVLKMMLGRFDFSWGRFLGMILPGRKSRGHALRHILGGYQTLFMRIAERVKDLRLGHDVEKVVRRREGDQTVIDITSGGRTEQFDALIITTPVSSIRKFLDMSPDEAQILAQVRSYDYVIHLFEAEGMQDYKGCMVLLDEYGEQSSIGHMTSLFNRREHPNIWTAGQLKTADHKLDDLLDILQADVAKLGGKVLRVRQSVVWDYLPHADCEALKNGFFARLGSLQGVQNTWFGGGLMNFESVEGVAAHAKMLAAGGEHDDRWTFAGDTLRMSPTSGQALCEETQSHRTV